MPQTQRSTRARVVLFSHLPAPEPVTTTPVATQASRDVHFSANATASRTPR